MTGRIGWGRLSPRQSHNGRASSPVRSTPICLFERQNVAHWLEISGKPSAPEFSPDTESVLRQLSDSGAMFFAELVRATGLLPSRVGEALAELVAHGLANSDSFEGLRALLVPSDKRTPLGQPERKGRHITVTSLEYAGRWTVLRKGLNGLRKLNELNGENKTKELGQAGGVLRNGKTNGEAIAHPSDEAIEAFARGLLRRYGIVFRRLLEREALKVPWFELGRFYRRLEARGEIRGGHFVNGVSGEQFALPGAIGLLRSLRNAAAKGELIVISGADPLNLVGILTPGARISAITANRILLRDGLPIAALDGGNVVQLENATEVSEREIEKALRVGRMAPALRPYYA
jgi:ATP-dependent Lhr-like helicase